MPDPTPTCPQNKTLRVHAQFKKADGTFATPDSPPQWGASNAQVFTTAQDTADGNMSAIIQPHGTGTAQVSVAATVEGHPAGKTHDILITPAPAVETVLTFDAPV